MRPRRDLGTDPGRHARCLLPSVFHTRQQREEFERARAGFYRRMQAAECCPIEGPCFECADPVPHHCPLAAVLRWEDDIEEAIALALDAVIYGDGHAQPLDQRAATEALLSRLCQEHHRLALGFLGRRFAVREKSGARRSGRGERRTG